MTASGASFDLKIGRFTLSKRLLASWRSQRTGTKVGFVILLILAVSAALAAVVSPYDPLALHPHDRFVGPSRTYLLGTDDFGRDELSMLLYGARISLSIAVLAETVAIILAVPVALVAGFKRGAFDALTMRVVDALLGVPAFLIALAIVGLFGASYRNLVVAIGIMNAPYLARVVRGATLIECEKTYVTAAEALGVRPTRLLLTDVLPNIGSPLIVQISFGLSVAVLQESALSFLGLGIQPPRQTWGSLLATGYSYIYQDAWLVIFPGLCIFATVWALNVMGDALRDALDPRLRAGAGLGK